MSLEFMLNAMRPLYRHLPSTCSGRSTKSGWMHVMRSGAFGETRQGRSKGESASDYQGGRLSAAQENQFHQRELRGKLKDAAAKTLKNCKPIVEFKECLSMYGTDFFKAVIMKTKELVLNERPDIYPTGLDHFWLDVAQTGFGT
ncbi:hypothetical protein Adt_20673 [Abeliophyllum distichum]|uniref:Uncharacterized protein n=1 Tax=Abeliophyllum distichum TaxID=126358 RepID=A0ABD1SX84_9LAMI